MLTVRREGLRLLVLVSGVTTIALGVAGIIGAQRLAGATDDAAFLSPVFALALMLCGIMLAIGRYRPSMAARAGVGALAVLLFFSGAAWWGGLAFGDRPVIVLVASAATVCGSMAAICLGRSPPSARIPENGSTLAAVVGVILAVSVSYAMIRDENLQANRYARTTAEQATENITRSMRYFVASIRRMSERWSANDHGVSEAYMEGELESYLRDFPSMGKISVQNVAGDVFFSRQRPEYSSGWISSAPEKDDVLTWLSNVAATGEPGLSPFYRERSDGTWGVIAAPVDNSGKDGEVIAAQINITRVLRQALAGNEDIADFHIRSGSHVLYQSEDAPVKRLTPVAQQDIGFRDGPAWAMSYHLTSSELGPGISRGQSLPEIYLIAFLLFTLAMASSLRFSAIARHRSRELMSAAVTDRLTGLPNRDRLEQLLRDTSEASRRRDSTFAVVSLSMNGLKLVSESLGHTVGDAILKEVSRRLQGDIPRNADVARFGDENFIVLLSDTNERGVEACVEKLIASLARPYSAQGQSLRLTAHAGYVVSSGDVCDPMQLAVEADLAMLDAKQGGEDAWKIYTADMNAHVKERVTLLSALQGAIEADTLALHYQPIVSGQSAQVVAVEALLRWRHPELGSVAPWRFLPLAEETGIIIPLTDWVLKTACRDSRRLRQKGFPEFPVVVNISPRYFNRDDFVTRIVSALEAVSLPPHFLGLEITEGLLLKNEEDAVKKLHALRRLGIVTAIDDFGTGYSSLSYLKNLPVDKVKLDGSFITDIEADASSAAITRGMISMAHHLDLKVVAEQVETQAQYAFLKESACDEFQGYLFSRPLEIDKLIAQLAQARCRAAVPGFSGAAP